MVYPRKMLTRLRARILERLDCQNLKVQIVRDKNVEKYLLQKHPRRITNRRQTAAVLTDIQVTPAQPAKVVSTNVQVAPPTKISLTKPIKNIPFGARGRKRLSLDAIPTGSSSGLHQPERTHSENQQNRHNVQPVQHAAHSQGMKMSNISAAGADAISEAAISTGNIDLVDSVDSSNVTVRLNFLDPNMGSLVYNDAYDESYESYESI